MKRRSRIGVLVFATALLASYPSAFAQKQPDAESAPESQRSSETRPLDQFELSNLSGAPAPFTVSYESRLTLHKDLSATRVTTKRLTINAASAIQTLGQQTIPYIDGMQVLDIVEAFTEKPDGRRIDVAPANILTQDMTSGQQATYYRDMKQRTVIFQDLGVGDTLVLTSKTEQKEGIFPGQFVDAQTFPRSLSFDWASVTVEAPAALDLKVKVTGDAGTEVVETSGDVRRHRITIATQGYHPEEPGAVAPIDRDPSLLVSTFSSYEQLGQAYGKSAFPKAAVTPEITALANEITRNIDDKRAQAAAIDAWVKKNIRYVAVYLSFGRVVPNSASDILRNRFGDCKDKVTLMLALLAAKGIAGEAALINLGNAYSLPDPVTLAVLNHVILYLPEFDLYDDPTATQAAFGVLSPSAYDKPVVRVSGAAAKLARTPAMHPKDHTTHIATTIRVAADGTVTGQTQETSTGVFGIFLRASGGQVQSIGEEAAAQRLLQSFNSPGTGQFTLGAISETRDPVLVSSSFVLNDRLKAPAAGGRVAIPFGMPISPRIGSLLFGTRLSGRLSAFGCYAGTQTEDLEMTFDPGLPMPTPIKPLRVDNTFFSYRSTYNIEGRTLKVHRDFIAHVPGQVCGPEVEAQIAGDLNTVRVDANTTYAFGISVQPPVSAAPTQPQTVEVKRAVAAGQKLRLDFMYSINVDCSSMGFPTVRIIEQPQHGRATAANGSGFTSFPQSNPRWACNKRSSEGTVLLYEPEANYTGTDMVAVETIFPSGSSTKRRYSLTVTPAVSTEANQPEQKLAIPTSLAEPKPLEITRVAAADQKLLVAFFVTLNPDCSSLGHATIRMIEQARHGKVTVEKTTGFSGYPQDNLRYECNKRRSEGVLISYLPEANFKGAESFTFDVITPDGGFSRRHYAVDVR